MSINNNATRIHIENEPETFEFTIIHSDANFLPDNIRNHPNAWTSIFDNHSLNRMRSIVNELFAVHNELDVIYEDNIMNALFEVDNEGYAIYEDHIMEIVQRESLDYYKTQEKKPGVKMCIPESFAADHHKDYSCTICVSSFNIGEKITELECKHVLHTECISEWVKYKAECPLCRHSISTKHD
jgi:hypothetical protein